MSYFNRVYLIGRFVKDPELKSGKEGSKFVVFRLAANEPAKKGEEKKTIFVDVTMSEPNATNVSKYCHKGDEVLVEGTLAQRKFAAKDGTEHIKTGIRGYNIQFLTHKAINNDGEPKESVGKGDQSPKENIDITDDIPF